MGLTGVIPVSLMAHRATENSPVEPLGKGKLIEYLGALEPGEYEELEPTAFGRVKNQLALRFGDAT